MDEKTALVTAVHKERYELLCDGVLIHGRLKTGVYIAKGTELYPTVGDLVTVQYNHGGDSSIIRTHPRKSFFSRLDPDKTRPREQAVAANFDYVFIMSSLNQDFNPRRIERYLALAWRSGATPVIVLTKADLTGSEPPQSLDEVACGVDVHVISAVSGLGLDGLDKYLSPDSTIVFLGSSGVGKSSLVNALAGGDVMTVKAIREDDAKGRHTTTHRQMIVLPCGAKIIDTPGMRELGIWDAGDGIGSVFGDVEALLGGCRFSDCRHESEPGCVIREALEGGTLSSERWDSYNKLKREERFAEDKAAAARERDEKHKAITKFLRKNYRDKRL